MAVIDLDSPFAHALLHDAAGAGAAPDANTDRVQVGRKNIIRTSVVYNGSVTAAVIRCWFWRGDHWVKGDKTDGTTALDPTLGSQSIDWLVGTESRCHFQIESLTGTGTLDVTASGHSK